jgi:hypothetical protein
VEGDRVDLVQLDHAGPGRVNASRYCAAPRTASRIRIASWRRRVGDSSLRGRIDGCVDA